MNNVFYKHKKLLMPFVAIFLCIVSVFSGFIFSFKGKNSNKVANAGGFVDGLTIFSFFQNLTGNIWDTVVSASDKSKSKGEQAEDAIASFLGSSAPMTKQLTNIESKIDGLKADIAEISTNVEKVSKQIEGLSTKIDGITTEIKNTVKLAVEEIVVNLNKTAVQLQNWTEIQNQVNSFYNKYVNLRSTLYHTIRKLSDGYQDNLIRQETIKKLPNGEQILNILNKLSLNYDKSFKELPKEEQDLLKTRISYKSVRDDNGDGQGDVVENEVGILFKNYIDATYNKMKETYKTLVSENTIDVVTNLVGMSDYITGKSSILNGKGIGEIYYQLCLMRYTNSDEVHAQYKNFMASITYDFALLAYVSSLSVNIQISYLKANFPDMVEELGDLKTDRNAICEEVDKMILFVDYEYKKCINTYDIDGVNLKNGTTIDDYIVLYGNPQNKVTYKIKNNFYIYKQDFNPTSYEVNNHFVNIACGETFKAKIYYNNQEVTAQKQLESKDTSVAVVSKNGEIIGVSSGSCVVGIRENKEFIPLFSVEVTRATATKNYENYDYWVKTKKVTQEEEVVFKLPSLSSKGGQTYNYDNRIIGAKECFDTNKTSVYNFLKSFNLTKEEAQKYTLTSSSQDIKVETKIATVADSSCCGSIFANVKVDDTSCVINIPVVNNYQTKKEISYEYKSTDLKNTDFQTAGSASSYKRYIFTKNDLKLLIQDLNSQNGKNITCISVEAILMNDIDMNWSVWDSISFSALTVKQTVTRIAGLTFDGNGHKIKNVTLKKTVIDDTKTKSYVYAMFPYINGTIKNLEVENVRYQDDTTLNQNYTTYHSVFVGDFDTYKVDGENVYGGESSLEHCVLSGNININANNKGINFSPFISKIHGEKATNDAYMPNLHNCIFKADVKIDNISDIIASTVALFEPSFHLESNVNAGKLALINLKNPNIFIFKEATYYQTHFAEVYYVNNNIKTTILNKNATIIPLDKLLSEEYWSLNGFNVAWYFLPNGDGTTLLPTLRKKGFYADTSNFKSTYLLNEKIDTSGLKFYNDEANVTDMVKIDSSLLDTKTLGTKSFEVTYNKELIKLNIQVVSQTAPIVLTYAEYKDGGKIIEENIQSGVGVNLKQKTFTQPGYDQTGWFDLLDLTTNYQFGQNVTFYKSAVLCPIFTERTDTPYKVNIYYQNIDDDEYTLHTTIDAKGTTDEAIKIPYYEGFTCIDKSTRISGDGTTVLNLRYNRKTFNVTFVLDSKYCETADGEYTFTQKVRYGKTFTSCPKEFTLKPHFKLVGFDKTFNKITSDTTYTAQFADVLYSVTFMLDDIVISQKTDYKFNDTVVIPADPYKPEDCYGTYTFVSWGEDFSNKVSGNKVYYAVFKLTKTEYTLTIPHGVTVVKNGTELTEKDIVYYDDILDITYTPDENYQKDKFIVNNAYLTEDNKYQVNGNVEIIFTQKLCKYTYTFLDDDNKTVLKQGTIDYGEIFTTPNVLDKEDNKYIYKFVGFSPDIDGSQIITKDITFVAIYQKIYKEYNIINKFTQNDSHINNGYIKVEGQNYYGNIITLTFVPNDGYMVKDITTTPNINLAGDGLTKTFALTEDIKVDCRFVKIEQTLNDEKDTSNQIKVDASIDIVGENGKLEVVNIDNKNDNYNKINKVVGKNKNIKIFDITLKNSEGQNLTNLNKKVKLKFKIPTDFDLSMVKIYRVENNKKIEYNFDIVGDYLEIETDHFSTYVVVETKNITNMIMAITIPFSIIIIFAICETVITLKRKKQNV